MRKRKSGARHRPFRARRGPPTIGRMAGEAKPTAEPAQQAAAGKITAKVEDQAAAAKQQPKEVLKLSQGKANPQVVNVLLNKRLGLAAEG